MKLIVIGISGISGGGKTTLATALYQCLSDTKNDHLFDGIHINEVVLIQQDKYFHKRDSPLHTWIPEINFINREILSAMNMDQFAEDVNDMVRRLNGDNSSSDSTVIIGNNARTSVNILIIEGYLIYNDERINQYFQLRFHVYLSYDVGMARRKIRTFKHVNPKPEWYFEHYIWKSYQKHLDEVPNKSDLVYLNGEESVDSVYDQALTTITKFVINQTKS